MRNRVFICYRRDDTGATVGRLTNDLHGFFGEKHVYRDIASSVVGSDWVRQIEEAIGSSAAFLVVIGPRWLAASADGARRLDDPSDTLRMEIAEALRQEVTVIPLLIEEARMPEGHQLPDELKPLSRIQARRLIDDHWDDDLRRLIEDLLRHGMQPQLAVSLLGAAYSHRTYERTLVAAQTAAFDAVTAVLEGLDWTVVRARDADTWTAWFSIHPLRDLRSGGLRRMKQAVKPELVATHWTAMVKVEEIGPGQAKLLLQLPTLKPPLRWGYFGALGLLEKHVAKALFDNTERILAGEGLEPSSPIPGVNHLRRWRQHASEA